MQKEDIKAIWDRYQQGNASKEETALLETWYLEYEHADLPALTEEEMSQRLAVVSAQLPLSRQSIQLWPRIAVAAAVIFVLAAGVLFYHVQRSNGINSIEIVNQVDLQPGQNTATLTLANGKTISLSNAKTGVIINGDLVIYNDSSSVNNAVADHNATEDGKSVDIPLLTASTPRGGQYQIILPDGTRVWLNAATSLQFPQQFTGAKERKVVLNGEAYFEVAKDKAHPFIITTTGQEVEVLGTHLNINSYADESVVRTTLLEGSVQVSAPGADNKKILSPGQQATLTGQGLKVAEVDPDQAIAWKNGVFYFYRADVKTVMRQLARWYNVEVTYEGTLPEHEFTGKIFRKVKASEALHILSELDVKFKIDGRKIIVSP